MDIYTIVLLVIVILVAGFFAGMETAFANVNRLSIELKKKQGKATGKILSGFNEQPARFLATSLIGLTLAIVVYSMLVAGWLDSLWALIWTENEMAQYVAI